MCISEYLYKASQGLMKRILMYINVDNYPCLLNIKNNDDIHFDADDYEWAIISMLLFSSEMYIHSENVKNKDIEDNLKEEDIVKIETLLSESDEILPGDDARQTQNCILDNDNNTILTFDYLINGNIDDFSIDAFLSDLDGFGSYYEDEIDIKNENYSEDKKMIRELKELRNQIIRKQIDANKANDKIILNNRLNTKNFVRLLRNALAHSQYVPYNDKQLKFFVGGKSNNHFNAIIDKQIVTSIFSMVYNTARLHYINKKEDFETLINEIEGYLKESLEDYHKQKEAITLLKKYCNQIEKSTNLKVTISNIINELPKFIYFYTKDEITNAIDASFDDDDTTEDELKEDILDDLYEIKNVIEEANPLDDAEFDDLYSCEDTTKFEEEAKTILIARLIRQIMSEEKDEAIISVLERISLESRYYTENGIISIVDNLPYDDKIKGEILDYLKIIKKTVEDFSEDLKIAKKNPNYDKNEIFNENKIGIILDIVKTKMDKKEEQLETLCNLTDIHTKFNKKRISIADYKLLIMSLLKCNLLDGYNINKDSKFETIDFSKFKISGKTRQMYEQERKIINSKIIEQENQNLLNMQNKLNKIIQKIEDKEKQLASQKVNNEYFLVRLPQDISNDKAKKKDIEDQISKLVIPTIDDLKNEIFDAKNINSYIMQHLRNALAHGNVDIKFIDKDLSNAIVYFKDIDKDNHDKLTFQCSIKLIDLLEIIASDEFQKTVFNVQENTNKKTK